MKKIDIDSASRVWRLFILWFLICQSVSVQSQEFKVITLNIRFDAPSDLENAWQYRRDAIVELIRHERPGFLGIQEGLMHQVTFMDSSLTEYRYIGVGREGNTVGEFSALFYQTSQFECVQSGTFWLSETPDTISKGWDAAYNRICTYGLFMHKATREKLWVFNTHFDHVGEVARKKSAELILTQIDVLTQGFRFPVVLMGDFNAAVKDEPIQIITKRVYDGRSIAKNAFVGHEGTFTGFNTIEDRKDYIFVHGIEVDDYVHSEARTEQGRWISDHLPVIATMHLNAGDKD